MSVTAQCSRDAVIAAFRAQMGFAAPKSWSRAKMVDAMAGKAVNKGATSKKIVTAAYVAKMGVGPAKTWTGAQIAAKLESETLPRGKAGTGNMTVVELRAWATSVGLTGRSKLNKAGLMAAYQARHVVAVAA